MFKHVAIFGLGLLGGSICRRLKKNDPAIRISAYGRDPARLAPALSESIIDSIGGFDRVSLAGVDLAIVSTPVDSSIDVIRQLLAHPELDQDALLIDVGSIKEGIIRSIETHERARQFVGCHPMAGSEKMGFEHSREDLFVGASVIITPHAKNTEHEVAAVRDFWESLGGLTIVVSPEVHDRIVAHTSHMPHVTACAIVRAFDGFRRGDDTAGGIDPYIGSGFRDATRIAAGSPDMWRDIAAFNSGNIAEAIDRVVNELVMLKKIISVPRPDKRALHEYFAGAKKIRDELK